MQTFTNKFSIAMNQDKTEVIINFFQNIPIVPVGNEPVARVGEMESELIPVSNIVMTGQCARNFLSTLSEMLNQEIPQE